MKAIIKQELCFGGDTWKKEIIITGESLAGIMFNYKCYVQQKAARSMQHVELQDSTADHYFSTDHGAELWTLVFE